MGSDNELPTSNTELGNRIKAAVAQRGTQREVSKLLEVALSTLGSWIAGKTEPSSTEAGKLAAVTGVSVSWLITGQGPMKAQATRAESPQSGTDTELLAVLSDGMMKLYKELAVTIVPAEFGRRLGQEHDDIVAAEPDPALRRDMVKLVLAKLRRELLTPTANDSRKQQA